MEKDCIFCGIIAGELSSDVVHRDEQVIAFRDITPQAPTHILVVPIAHIPSVAEVTPEHGALLGHMVQVANALARKEGIAETGYRLILNKGPHSGQLVDHLHLHVLGGRQLGRLG